MAWKELYQYSNAKGFPVSSYKNSVSTDKTVPKKLFEDWIPRCFPAGAQTYTESMMQWASNCKAKTAESFKMFKGIYSEKLQDDGFMMNASTSENPFENMEANTRLQKTMQNFKVHTAPAYQ